MELPRGRECDGLLCYVDRIAQPQQSMPFQGNLCLPLCFMVCRHSIVDKGPAIFGREPPQATAYSKVLYVNLTEC